MPIDRPFINLDGRAGWKDGRLSMEAEASAPSRLADGTQPWRRVASYWRKPQLLKQMRSPGAAECEQDTERWSDTAFCRAFIIDNPWSAAFVSYVMKSAAMKPAAMKSAGLQDFLFSPRHSDYIFDAYRADRSKPYRMIAPHRETPAIGDLVCYSRSATIRNYEELVAFFDKGGRRLDAHCDIVVGVDLNGDSKLYAIGGNVLHTVIMRKLALNARGRFSPPTRIDGACGLNAEQDCSLNRKYWIALLKLQR
jgi:hypothetical protein